MKRRHHRHLHKEIDTTKQLEKKEMNLNDYYKDDDPRNKQPEVPELEMCECCSLLFEESTLQEVNGVLLCGEECIELYWKE